MAPQIRVDDHLLKEAPPTIRLIPDFITAEEEVHLLERIYAAPKPKWQSLSNRRLQNWGGIVGKRFLIPDGDLPQWLSSVIDRICGVEGAFLDDHRPNHVLINEYLPGQGIMPHTDGPAYFPLVSTISLGSHTLLDLYTPGDGARERVGSIFVPQRSLLLLCGPSYSMLHGIEERVEDRLDGSNIFNRPGGMEAGTKLERSTRVSLTIRNVPAVRKGLFNC